MYGVAGVSLYAMMLHGLIALRRPVDRVHLLFALICLTVALYVLAKAGAYNATTVDELVEMRRWETAWAMIVMAILPWFVGEYTGVKPHLLRAMLSAPLLAVLAANMILPLGAGYSELPQLGTLQLPWGEAVRDLRYQDRTIWYHLAWAGIFLNMGFGAYAAIQQYRTGRHRRAFLLGLGLSLFCLALIVNAAVNFGLINFVHTAEFGVLGLTVVMNLALIDEIRKRERWFRAILDNVPAIVFAKDVDGRYLAVNRQFEQRFRIDRLAVIGKDDFELFPAADAKAFRENDRLALASGHPVEFEESVDHSGETRTYFSLKFALRESGGRAYATCGVSTDITDLRRVEGKMHDMASQVWHADRVARAGALTSSLAHELNQPLTAILSNAQAGLRFLSAREPDLAELCNLLEDIVRDDKRAASVIVGLRTMVRKQDTEYQAVEMSKTVSETLEMLHGELLTSRTTLEFEAEPGLSVHADKAQIQQIMVNLVMNAIAAMSQDEGAPRELRVRVARASAERVRVTIHDTGPGVPTDRIDTIFQAFHTTKAQGLGLGLAICRSIVEAHGGRIWILNNDDGPGATFIFELPIVAISPSNALTAASNSMVRDR